MKKIFCVISMLALLAFSNQVFAEDLGDGYAIDVHDGWQLAEFPGLKCKIIMTAPISGFSPNVNVLDEEYPGTLSDYVELSSLNAKGTFEGYKEVSRNSFTAKNTEGIKLVTNAIHNSRELLQVFYFFENTKGKKVIVTCSAPVEVSDALTAEFDKLMSSFSVN